MKRYLPFVIIGIVLIAAVVSASILLRKKSGTEPTNVLNDTEKSTPVPANGSATNSTPANSEVQITKPNVKVSSPEVLSSGWYRFVAPCWDGTSRNVSAGGHRRGGDRAGPPSTRELSGSDHHGSDRSWFGRKSERKATLH